MEAQGAYVLAGVAAAALVTAVAVRVVQHRRIRSAALMLTAHHAAIASGLKTTSAVLEGLVRSDVDAILAFCSEHSEERQAIAEIAERMRVERTELGEFVAPKALRGVALTLSRAAEALEAETRRVGEARGEEVLDALLAVDLAGVHGMLLEAAAEIKRLSELYGLSDEGVYGGGLYI